MRKGDLERMAKRGDGLVRAGEEKRPICESISIIQIGPEGKGKKFRGAEKKSD